MKKLILLLIWIAMGSFGSLKAHKSDHALKSNLQYLLQLDSIIADNSIVVRKENRITELTGILRSLQSPSEKLGVTRQLYEEYQLFNSDSALHYASESKRLAEASHPDNYDLIAEWKLKRIFLLIVQGLYHQAKAEADSIDSGRLNIDNKLEYFNLNWYGHTMQSLYIKSDHERWEQEMLSSKQYLDSIKAYDHAGDKSWLWVPVAQALDMEERKVDADDLTRLSQAADNAGEPSRTNAINAYWLSQYYCLNHDEEKMIRYLAIAAINDAKIANREIAAVQELALWLYDHGDLNRAYNYLLYAVNQANTYNNRVRMVSLSTVLPMVRDSYRAEVEKRDQYLYTFAWTLGILSLILAISIGIIIFEFLRLRKVRNQLSATNRELTVAVRDRDNAIDRLQELNQELHAANSQKLGVLAYTFMLATEYLNAIEDYRKKLLRQYKAKHIDDLGVLINDPELLKDHYQNFYKAFDKYVLFIFPDLVNDYNSSEPEGQKVPHEEVRKTQSLNTKLRIYALKRLGISKSADIAKMLNISIRTVYNNNHNDTRGSEIENDPC